MRILRVAQRTSLHAPCYNTPIITDSKATVESLSGGDGGGRTGSNCGGYGERAMLGSGGDEFWAQEETVGEFVSCGCS